jgi:uncharacterized protein YdcH (DUF465 family)
MPASDQELRQELLETNESFRRLYEEHQKLERRLEGLLSKTLPSENDEIEEKQIKLQKLHLKDQMEAMLREAKTAQPAS